jgi:hypothetical protein
VALSLNNCIIARAGLSKKKFGQPNTAILLPKAPNSSFTSVFGSHVGQKLHNFKNSCAFGRAISVSGCLIRSFWIAPSRPVDRIFSEKPISLLTLKKPAAELAAGFFKINEISTY